MDLDKNIQVIIVGSVDDEHFTYINNGKNIYYKFYFDGYEGNSSVKIISFLEFLGYKVFEVHRSSFNVPKEYIVN